VPTMPWSSFALASSQAILGHDLDYSNEKECNATDCNVLECAVVFPKRYAGQSPITPWTNWCCVGTSTMHVQFHVRYMSCCQNLWNNLEKTHHHSGLIFDRARRTVVDDIGDRLTLTEARSSIAILASRTKERLYYNIVTLTDSSVLSLDCIEERSRWKALKLNSCPELPGVAIFQFALHHLIWKWYGEWSQYAEFLKKLDKTKVFNSSTVQCMEN
jgi:hypothetical protein